MTDEQIFILMCTLVLLYTLDYVYLKENVTNFLWNLLVMMFVFITATPVLIAGFFAGYLIRWLIAGFKRGMNYEHPTL